MLSTVFNRQSLENQNQVCLITLKTAMKMSKKEINCLSSPVISLLLITLITTLLISTGSLNSSDALKRLQVTHWLWTDTPQVKIDDSENRLFAIGRDEKKYATWGLGHSLVMLPADIISHKLTYGIPVQEKILEKIRAGIVAYLTFPTINILSIIISFRFLQNLGFSNRQSIFGALGFLFGTSFLAYAQSHQENSLIFLMTMSGYLLNLVWVISNSSSLLFLGACALGFNLLVRLTTLVDIFSVSLFTGSILIIQTKAKNWDLSFLRNRSWKYLLICGPTYLFFLGLDRLYHWIRFDTFKGTYLRIWAEQAKSIDPSLPASFPFSTPFPTGFFGLLFSPERSIFLFDPLLIVTFILSLRYWKRLSYVVKALLISLNFLLFTYISFYAKWFAWGGAGSWGSRFTTVPVQLLSLLSIPLLLKLYPFIKGKLEKTFYKVTILLSIFIQLSSVILNYNLELSQASSLQKPLFVIGQRFVNLVAIWTGNFKTWNLIPTNSSSTVVQKWVTPLFMPWATFGELPTPLSYILQVIWFAGLIVLILLIAIFIRKTSCGIYDSYSNSRRK